MSPRFRNSDWLDLAMLLVGEPISVFPNSMSIFQLVGIYGPMRSHTVEQVFCFVRWTLFADALKAKSNRRFKFCKQPQRVGCFKHFCGTDNFAKFEICGQYAAIQANLRNRSLDSESRGEEFSLHCLDSPAPFLAFRRHYFSSLRESPETPSYSMVWRYAHESYR